MHLTGGVNIYLCVVPVCSVCVISNQGTSKNHVIRVKSSVSKFSKFNALLLVAYNTKQGAFGTNVPRLDKFWAIILWSNITHYMRLNETFSQRNKARKRAGGGGWTKFEKSEVRNDGGLGNFCQLYKHEQEYILNKIYELVKNRPTGTVL